MAKARRVYPAAGQRSEGGEYARDDGGAAVQVDFGKIFTAGAGGAGEDGDQGFIEQSAARVQPAQAEAAGWRDAGRKRLHGGKGGRAGQADDGERRWGPTAGQRRDGGGHLVWFSLASCQRRR